MRRQWYRLWDCYKACRRREEHTGGGDGNAVDVTEVESVPSEGEIETKGKKTGGNSKHAGPMNTRGQFSMHVLDMFAMSRCYQMIDEV